MATGFRNEELRDGVAVRSVTADSARIWMRTSRSGEHRIRWWPADAEADVSELAFDAPTDEGADHTHAVDIPADGSRLDPLTRYRYRVTAGNHEIGEGRFRTFPEDADGTPETFSFGIMSCNQPFDDEGNVRPDARAMLRATYTALDRHDCAFVMNTGDLVYSDMPTSLSLFNQDYFEQVAPPGRASIQECTTTEVRRLYHRRQRHFWNLPELRRIVADFPHFTMLDDHDIVDNWGSDPDHQNAEWRSIGEGARAAFFDYHGSYQSPRPASLPESFHYEFTYGHSSVFVMDLRSERWVDGDEGRLFSDRQQEDLYAFLDRSRKQKALFIVLSVPPAHLPRFLANTVARLSSNGEDFSDRWSSLGHIDDRNRFMQCMREHQKEHPEQRLAFLSGDIHVGCAHEIVWDDRSGAIYQLVSSGLTNKVSRPIQFGAKWLMRLNAGIDTRDGAPTADVNRIPGVHGLRKNPYASLNVGIVQVSASQPDQPATLEYLLYGHDGDEPVRVYQTPKL